MMFSITKLIAFFLVLIPSRNCRCTTDASTLQHNSSGSELQNRNRRQLSDGPSHLLNRVLIEDDLSVRQILKLRLGLLKRFAFGASAVAQAPPPRQCSTTNFVYISEYPFGNSGNNLVEFTHGLWLAETWNATFIVPKWMKNVLDPFDTSFLRAHYCFRMKSALPQGKTLLEVTSEESFFLFQLFKNQKYVASLPPLNEATISELSLHFLKVYAGLWCCPQADIVAEGEWLIHNQLANSLRFVAVHKRDMEGGCSKVMSSVTTPADFSPADLPMHRVEWQGNLQQQHPLCEMPYGFIHETISMHNRNGSRVFVAWDGRGDMSRYIKHGAVFTANVVMPSAARANPKFVDMFVAMHAEFFILNPRSTFSWQIYLIRVCLALISVPVMRNNDLYLQKVPDSLRDRPLWVSWTSVVDAFMKAIPSA